jgi:hypothetical protein
MQSKVKISSARDGPIRLREFQLKTIAGFFALWAGTVLVAAPGMSWAQQTPPVFARAQACLEANVERVVAAETDVTSAATFLLNYTCAAEVQAAGRYERNSVFVKGMTSLFSGAITDSVANKGADPASTKLIPSASVNPETGEIVTPPRPPRSPFNPAEALLPSMGSQALFPESPPVTLRHLAGDLVLAASERQITGKR